MDARFGLFAVGDGNESFAFKELGSVVEGDRIEVVGAAELFDVESELAVFARADGQLVVVADGFVGTGNELGCGVVEFVRGVEAFYVVFVVEHHGIGFLSVAAGTSCLLKVGFDG